MSFESFKKSIKPEDVNSEYYASLEKNISKHTQKETQVPPEFGSPYSTTIKVLKDDFQPVMEYHSDFRVYKIAKRDVKKFKYEVNRTSNHKELIRRIIRETFNKETVIEATFDKPGEQTVWFKVNEGGSKKEQILASAQLPLNEDVVNLCVLTFLSRLSPDLFKKVQSDLSEKSKNELDLFQKALKEENKFAHFTGTNGNSDKQTTSKSSSTRTASPKPSINKMEGELASVGPLKKTAEKIIEEEILPETNKQTIIEDKPAAKKDRSKTPSEKPNKSKRLKESERVIDVVKNQTESRADNKARKKRPSPTKEVMIQDDDVIMEEVPINTSQKTSPAVRSGRRTNPNNLNISLVEEVDTSKIIDKKKVAKGQKMSDTPKPVEDISGLVKRPPSIATAKSEIPITKKTKKPESKKKDKAQGKELLHPNVEKETMKEVVGKQGPAQAIKSNTSYFCEKPQDIPHKPEVAINEIDKPKSKGVSNEPKRPKDIHRESNKPAIVKAASKASTKARGENSQKKIAKTKNNTESVVKKEPEENWKSIGNEEAKDTVRSRSGQMHQMTDQTKGSEAERKKKANPNDPRVRTDSSTLKNDKPVKPKEEEIQVIGRSSNPMPSISNSRSQIAKASKHQSGKNEPLKDETLPGDREKLKYQRRHRMDENDQGREFRERQPPGDIHHSKPSYPNAQASARGQTPSKNDVKFMTNHQDRGKFEHQIPKDHYRSSRDLPDRMAKRDSNHANRDSYMGRNCSTPQNRGQGMSSDRRYQEEGQHQHRFQKDKAPVSGNYQGNHENRQHSKPMSSNRNLSMKHSSDNHGKHNNHQNGWKSRDQASSGPNKGPQPHYDQKGKIYDEKPSGHHGYHNKYERPAKQFTDGRKNQYFDHHDQQKGMVHDGERDGRHHGSYKYGGKQDDRPYQRGEAGNGKQGREQSRDLGWRNDNASNYNNKSNPRWNENSRTDAGSGMDKRHSANQDSRDPRNKVQEDRSHHQNSNKPSHYNQGYKGRSERFVPEEFKENRNESYNKAKNEFNQKDRSASRPDRGRNQHRSSNIESNQMRFRRWDQTLSKDPNMIDNGLEAINID